MLRVFRFNSGTYLEIRNDETATGQAIAALFLASLSYAIGFSFLTESLDLYSLVVGALTQLIISMMAGLVWALMAFFIGTKLFQGKAKFWQLARPLFFSATPGIFLILIAIPIEPVYRTIAAVFAAWIIIGGVVALKNSMGFGYDRSMLTYIVGFLAGIAIAGFFGI
jgi:Yip1-like protein